LASHTNDEPSCRIQDWSKVCEPMTEYADPNSRAVYNVGLRPFACWDSVFESRQVHECLSLSSIGCCQVEVSSTGRSLVKRTPTKCGVSECDREAPIMRRPWPSSRWCAMGEKM